MKTGMRGGSLKILSEEEVERLHQAALSLLWDPGLFSESSAFLDIFAKGGADVDRDARIIRLPAEMVEAAIASAPSSIVLHGRHDEANSLLLEPGRVYYGMGGTSEPLFFDYQLGHARNPPSRIWFRAPAWDMPCPTSTSSRRCVWQATARRERSSSTTLTPSSATPASPR